MITNQLKPILLQKKISSMFIAVALMFVFMQVTQLMGQTNDSIPETGVVIETDVSAPQETTETSTQTPAAPVPQETTVVSPQQPTPQAVLPVSKLPTTSESTPLTKAEPNTTLQLRGGMTMSFDALSFAGTLGSSPSVLSPGSDGSLFPESSFTYLGNIGIVGANKSGVEFGAMFRYGNAIPGIVNNVYDYKTGQYSLKPGNSLTAGLHDKKQNLMLAAGVSKLSVNYKELINIEFGPQVEMYMGDNVLNNTGTALKTTLTTKPVSYTFIGTRLGSSYDRSSIPNISESMAAPYNDSYARYLTAMKFDFHLPSKIDLGASWVSMFGRNQERGGSVTSVTKNLYIKITSTAQGTSRHPFLMGKADSKIILKLKEKQDFVYSDLSAQGVMITPSLLVQSPVITSGDMSDSKKFEGDDDGLYIQPSESYARAADFYKNYVMLAIPLEKVGAYSFGEIEQIVFSLAMRYNYKIEISLDQFSWQTIIDSKIVNYGYSDLGNFSQVHKNSIPHYGANSVGADEPYQVTAVVNPKNFHLPKTRDIVALAGSYRGGATKINSEVAYNYGQFYNSSSVGTLAYNFNAKSTLNNYLFGFSAAGVDSLYSTRFDGLATGDFNNIANAASRPARADSGLYSSFDAVWDNDNRTSLIGRTGEISSPWADNTETYIAGRNLAGSYGQFSRALDRPYLTFIRDENNNGYADNEENDIYSDYSVRTGQRAFKLYGNKQKGNFKPFLFASFVTQKPQPKVFTAYEFDHDSTNATYQSTTPISESRNALTLEAGVEYRNAPKNEKSYNVGVNLKVVQDAIADHLYDQRKINYYNESQISHFDALLNYNKISLDIKGSHQQKSFGDLNINHFARLGADLYRTDDSFKDKIELERIDTNSFFTATRINGMEDAIAKAKLIYANDAPLRTGLRAVYDFEGFILLPLPNGFQWKSGIFKHSVIKYIKSIDEYLVSDFSFYTVFSTEITESLSAVADFRLRYSEDWQEKELYDGKGAFATISANYRMKNVNIFAGFRSFSYNYKIDTLSRRDVSGSPLTDTVGTQFFVTTTVNF